MTPIQPDPERVIRPITTRDAAEVAALHAEVFHGAFLTRLGPRIVEAFYAAIAGDPIGHGRVAVTDGKVVGFVAGVEAARPFYRAFYRRYLGRVLLAAARRAVGDPEVRRTLSRRLRHARHLLPAWAGRQGSAPAGGGSPAVARLLSIGVTPPVRGTGVAEALVDGLCDGLHERGIEVVGLSVRLDNGRAGAFYARSGWEVERRTDDAVYLRRATRR